MVNPTNVPPYATFWFLSTFDTNRYGFGPPLPWNPFNTKLDVPIYFWRGNSYVVDDTGLPPQEQEQFFRTSQSENEMLVTSQGAEGGGEYGPLDAQYSYPSNYLWLSIEVVSNGTAFVTAHGTVSDQIYELLSREKLTDTNWLSEGTFLGAKNQDWTPTTIAVGNRTNSLFIWCPSWIDEDGDGLPSWWEMQYGLDPNNPDTGNTGIPDGYKNPMGDGWNNLYKYEHGMNPNQFYTPPPPRNVQARLDATGTNVILTWESGGGPVISYGIEAPCGYYSPAEITTVSSSTLTYTAAAGPWFLGWWSDSPCFQIRAYFANGTHVDSAPVRVSKTALSLAASVVRGPLAQPFLAIPAIPPNVARIRVVSWANSFNTPIPWTDLYPSNFVNGITPLPASQFQDYLDWYLLQAVATNGDFGETMTIYNPYIADENDGWESLAATNFINAAAHMKENLRFLVRSATLTQPFSYSSGLRVHSEFTTANPDDSELPYPEWWYARPGTATNYEYYGYHTFSSNLNYSILQELRPVVENHLWRNFVYDLADYGEFGGTNGSFFWTFTPAMRALGYPMNHRFTGSAAGPFPLAFSTTNAAYLLSGWLPDPSFWSEWDYDEALEQGLAVNTSSGFAAYLPSGRRNLFGLPIGVLLSDNDSSHSPDLFPAGGSPIQTRQSFAFLNCSDPGLQIVDYYFASQTPYFHSYTNALDYSTQFPAPPFPGSSTFSVTNTSRLLLTGLGQPITVSGWAKMAITNGYAGKYAYLEQYWDDAYTLVTSNQTGLLSPYGEFFPTEPGPTALVTMPDVDTGQRGTGIVNVIKLQLDVNHDGVMDLTFGGPDNTSQDRPFVFWINNDRDISSLNADDPGHDIPTAPPTTLHRAAPLDCEDNFIESQRDLEDFTRLWICGLPALWASNGYQATLSLANVSGTPSINLFRSVETNGGIGYLTSTNIALQQLSGAGSLIFSGPGKKIGTISSNQSFTFPVNFFTNSADRYFLIEGVTEGRGELQLTITQNGQIVAKTSAWLDLHDVKDFYERMVVSNNFNGAISNWTTGIGGVEYASAAFGDDKDIIVLVHGIHVTQTDWLIESDTVFKRLYQSGYHGKFATVKWPCEIFTLWGALMQDYTIFNRSEFKAYKSGLAIKTYADQLHARFPDHRLHVLVHSQGNAVVSTAVAQGAAFDTYILTEGAVPASAYDVNYPLHTGLTNAEALHGPTPEWQPMGYRGAYTNLTGRIVNFYNVNDAVLAIWINDQGAAKPNLPSTDYHYNGTIVTYEPPFGSSYTVTDPQESRAYASRSRTEPIGRSPPETAHGVIQSGIDLHVRYGFNNSFPDDHSAQWAWPIQTTRPYYLQILDSINP